MKHWSGWKKMIKDIQSEGKVTIVALITKCDKGKTNKDTPYLSLTLEDASGQLDAKFWNLTEEKANEYHTGMVVEAVGDVILYRNAYQFRVRKMTEQPEEDMTDYVRRAPMSDQELRDSVQELLEKMDDEDLRLMTESVLDQVGKKFYKYPAATKNHHNYVGGLAYHSVTMARLALQICEMYPWLDTSLLIAASLLHDVGKVYELSEPILPQYTVEGNLLGHISIMNGEVGKLAQELGLEQSESVMLLKHMILSHHGKMEFGSPVLPMIPEAEVLTLIDNLDARMFMMKESLDATTPGQFGPRVFALENRMMYRRRDKK